MKNLRQMGPTWLLLLVILFSQSPFIFAGKGTPKNHSQSISAKEFLSSPFAKFFKARQYKKALKALKPLRRKYPNDPLIQRYRALTLERLGRTQEAIVIYRKLLLRNPRHGPTRTFLGRAYARQGKTEAAAQEFRSVLRDGKQEAYRIWSQAELKRLQLRVKKAQKKRFYFVGKSGIAYDSNPRLFPNDKALSRPGQGKQGIDYLLEWTAGYALLKRPKERLDLVYIGQETLHNGGASDVNFSSQGFALSTKIRRFLGRRAVLFGGRYDFKANFLKTNLFSISNRFFLGADTSLLKRTRTHLYTRFNILNFGRDGSNPPQTSRDGFRMGVGITQYFYTPSLQRYFFVKEEFNFNETRGDNFERFGILSRVGIHTPVDFFKKLDFDISGGFDYGDYPDFSSLSTLDLEERGDKRWDIYTALTYHWTPRFATRSFYRFIKADNDNNFFNRDRHMAGVNIIFSF